MKELSIEEKARRYDEAIEAAKAVIRDYESRNLTDILFYAREDLSVIFPELKESKDERIRKALLEMVHDTTGDELWVDYNIHKEEALAWLEKQSKASKVEEAMRDVEQKATAFTKVHAGETSEEILAQMRGQ